MRRLLRHDDQRCCPGFGTRARWQLLVTGNTAALAADLDGVLYESRGRQTLRNIAEPLEIFAVVRMDEDAEHLVVDPVCQMAVDRNEQSVA